MRVYGLQFDIAWESKESNRERLLQLFQEKSPQRGSMVVLPEMTCTGFTQRLDGLAEDAGSETEDFYGELASRFGVTVVGGVIHWGASGKGRNMAVVYAPDGHKLTQYCKVHPFTYGGESEFFEKGDDTTMFSWEGLQVAPLVCYDLRFPELFRSLAGVEVFLVIANWPAPREKHWMTLLQARAIENQAYVVGVNRCGQDPKTNYSGRSLIVDPQGNIVADGQSAEGWIQAELDIAELRAYRARFPALADRRRLPCYAQ